MPPAEWRYRRMECLIRDVYECQDCGELGGPKGDAILEAHHKVPVHSGGSDELDNLTTLCYPCHSKRHSESVEDSDRLNMSELVGVGLSCAEAVDYMATVIEGQTQTEWAEIRGVTQPTVSENVSKAAGVIREALD